MDEQSTSIWGFLDRIYDGVSGLGGKILDTINTKNLTEAQIAAARAQEAQASASAVQSQAFAGVAPFFGTDTTKLAIAGIAAFIAFKFLK